ncbi:MAG: hypothetical protein EBZ48_17770 [Proteobacteria bacterium]|nr:hypothetical protein [Pseudomonadota bacterium]
MAGAAFFATGDFRAATFPLVGVMAPIFQSPCHAPELHPVELARDELDRDELERLDELFDLWADDFFAINPR